VTKLACERGGGVPRVAFWEEGGGEKERGRATGVKVEAARRRAG
jgi:hypothetical protein